MIKNKKNTIRGVKNLLTTLVLAFFLIPSKNYSQLHQYVDPLIGSAGSGNVFVGPSCPYGMVKPGPDIDKNSNTGYTADKSKSVYGFSQIHVSGTGGGPKYGNISVMPFSGDFDSIQQESLRENEDVALGYYGVLLKKWHIKTEITTTPKVAYYSFSFLNQGKKAIKIDCGQFLGELEIPDGREAQQFVGSEIEVVSSTEVRGFTRIRGGWNNGPAYTVYFSAVFSKAFDTFKTWKDQQFFENQKIQIDEGKKTGAMLFFDGDKSEKIEMKIGISFISPLKARQNIDTAIPNWDFKQVLRATQNTWEQFLKTVELSADATLEQKKIFYTGLYHTVLMPVDRTGENPLWENNGPYYDDFYALWDTYRSSNPLITLLAPSREVAIVNALIQIYKKEGYMPDARSGNANGRTQGGSNADIVIADAFVKGLPGINYKLGLEAMMKDAEVPPGGNEEKEGRGGLVDYTKLGYVSTNYVRSGNRTVEYAYNDYCIAIVAKNLKRKGEYWRYIERADNWQNLWRDVEDYGTRGFIMPKNEKGEWVDDFQCEIKNGRVTTMKYGPHAQDWPICVCWWCAFMYEASSWEYSLGIPHDVAMLIKKSGGNGAFKKRLDTLFDEGFYNVANEPSFLSPNLYHWIGRPDLSNERIHQIIDQYFNASTSGIPGNDDSGSMSSWLSFHMMGLYPNAGQSYYLINAPYFKQTVIHQENGKDFAIKAENLSAKNKYIVSATLNGIAYDKAFIEHKDIVKGGELILKMGTTPAAWGTKIVPPSKSTTKEIGPANH